MNSKLPLNLDDLLRQRTVEGEHIEYKAGWNSDPIIRTLCAFANDFENLGGYVILEQDCDESGRPIFPRRAFRRSSGQNPAGAARLLQPDPAPLFPDSERRGVRRQKADRPVGARRAEPALQGAAGRDRQAQDLPLLHPPLRQHHRGPGRGRAGVLSLAATVRTIREALKR